MEAVCSSVLDRAGRSKKEPRRSAAPRCRPGLPAQAELLDEGLVARGILAVQVIEQAAAAVDNLQQTTTAVVVVLVGLEVLGQVHDAGGEQGDLDFRRAGVVVADRKTGVWGKGGSVRVDIGG